MRIDHGGDFQKFFGPLAFCQILKPRTPSAKAEKPEGV